MCAAAAAFALGVRFGHWQSRLIRLTRLSTRLTRLDLLDSLDSTHSTRLAARRLSLGDRQCYRYVHVASYALPVLASS